MFQHSARLRLIAAALLICVGLGLLFGPGLWARLFSKSFSLMPPQTPVPASLSTISIPRAQGLFKPFLLVVPQHTTVIWQNNDSAMHVVTTTAQASGFLNPQTFSFHIPASKQSKVTFNRAGLYHYYDTTMSSWNTKLARVSPHPDTPNYPLAMDGVIWVQGPISNLTEAVINPIPTGHDLFTSEFLAITQPGGVSWHNFDEDPHFVGLVSGWTAPVNPTDIGLVRIAGTNDVVEGATSTLLFTQPGLYYYYCRNHDQVDPFTHRAQALPMGSEYPIPMEGFVLVLGT